MATRIFFALMIVLATACSSASPGPAGSGGGGQEVTTPSGLKYTDEVVGTGKQPQAGQTAVDGDERFPIPPLAELVDLHERLALPARRARVAAIALNTRDLDESGARDAIAAAEAETGLPADDPVRFGAGRITSFVLETVAETG